jgi:hypothetical protein
MKSRVGSKNPGIPPRTSAFCGALPDFEYRREPPCNFFGITPMSTLSTKRKWQCTADQPELGCVYGSGTTSE